MVAELSISVFVRDCASRLAMIMANNVYCGAINIIKACRRKEGDSIAECEMGVFCSGIMEGKW